MDVAVVQTGTANTASVIAGFRRLGATPTVTTNSDDVRNAHRLVLPGVGAFAAAMEQLQSLDLIDPLRERITNKKPTLTICLGLQLLLEGSQESPGIGGLGMIPGEATRFPDHVLVPQLGWNKISVSPGCKLLADGYAYFANSYRLEFAPDDWACATSEHGGSFVAAIEQDTLLACQFHPELSGRWGHELLARWLETGGSPC